MKKKKYLPLYYKWLKTGVIPRDGLCHSLGIGDDYLGLFSPDYGGGYWGYWGEFSEYPILTQHV